MEIKLRVQEEANTIHDDKKYLVLMLFLCLFFIDVSLFAQIKSVTCHIAN